MPMAMEHKAGQGTIIEALPIFRDRARATSLPVGGIVDEGIVGGLASSPSCVTVERVFLRCMTEPNV